MLSPRSQFFKAAQERGQRSGPEGGLSNSAAAHCTAWHAPVAASECTGRVAPFLGLPGRKAANTKTPVHLGRIGRMQRGLTPRSTGPATASTVSPASASSNIVAVRAYDACLHGPVSSNVRPHRTRLWRLHRQRLKLRRSQTPRACPQRTRRFQARAARTDEHIESDRQQQDQYRESATPRRDTRFCSPGLEIWRTPDRPKRKRRRISSSPVLPANHEVPRRARATLGPVCFDQRSKDAPRRSRRD